MIETQIEYFKDGAGEWRWTAVAVENGKAIADSSEGYKRKSDARAMVARLFFGSASNRYIEVDR